MSSKLSKIYSEQQIDYHQQKIEQKSEFLEFLDDFQECKKPEKCTKQIKQKKGLILASL